MDLLSKKEAANETRLRLCSAKLLSDLHDRDLLTILAQALELHLARLQSKQGVVAALAHVHTGVDVGAALTDQDVAGQNKLTVCTLGAQTLSESRPLRVEPTPFLWAKNCKPIFSISYTSKTVIWSGYSSAKATKCTMRAVRRV